MFEGCDIDIDLFGAVGAFCIIVMHLFLFFFGKLLIQSVDFENSKYKFVIDKSWTQHRQRNKEIIIIFLQI